MGERVLLDREAADELRSRGRAAHTAYASCLAGLLRVVAEQVKLGLWRLDGARSPSVWVAGTYGVCAATARSWVRQAEALAERPALVDAMCTGRISVDDAESIVTLSEGEPALAEVWLEAREAEALSPQDLRFEARKFVSQKTAEEGRARYLSVTPSPDERWMDIKGRVDAAEGAELLDVLDSTVDPNTRAWLMPEARVMSLMRLVRGGATGRSERRPTLVVHVDQDTLLKGDGVGVTQMGTFLDPERVRTISCDAHLEHVIEANGIPVAIWSERRIVPAPMRRAVVARDKHCKAPGCGSGFDLEVHHIVPWWRGGKTEMENLLLLCRPCHINFHRRSVTARPRLTTQPKVPRGPDHAA